MADPDWLEVLKPLGVAVPLVAVLFYLLRQATEERRAITGDFLRTLRETVAANADSISKVTAALAELTSATRERKEESSDEHNKMIDLLTRIATMLDRADRR